MATTGGTEGTPGVALVTGAGQGLGAAIAGALASAGWAVAVNDLPAAGGEARSETVAVSIRRAGGVARSFPADATDEVSVSAMVSEIELGWGPVRVLVVNATGPQPVIGLRDLRWAEMLDQLHFFVKSPLLLTQAVLPGMIARGDGRIIQIGSDLFERAEPGMSAYSSAKGAQLGLTRTWARELGPLGITVNLVAPGWIPVERHAGVGSDVVSTYTGQVPLRRMGVPADVAGAVVFLASDSARFITGERLAVNGGHVLA